jgi:protein-tyrosine phosphatase
MAEAVFQQMVDSAGLSAQITVDSVATSVYHRGERAHPGTRRVLAQHGINYEGYARQITQADVTNPSTYVVVMDQSNLADVRRAFGELPHLYRLLDFANETAVQDVPDPFFTHNFDDVFQLIHAGCRGLLATIRREEGL